MGSNSYDRIIWDKGRTHAVDPVLIKAIVASESNFNPRAKRDEPRIGDASYGLMQTLYRTARDMGYDGPPEGLFDPATSIEYGTRYLKRQLLRYGGATDFAIAAYNSGTAYKREDGSFVNQAYVDRVKRWYARFKGQQREEQDPGVLLRSDLPQIGPVPSSTPIRLAAARSPDGARMATVETLFNEETAPWVIAFGGAMLLAALGSRR